MIAWNINYFALFAAVVVNMGLGMLWYSPLMFQRKWMEWASIKKIEKPEPAVYLTSAFTSLLKAFILLQLITMYNIMAIRIGVCLAVIAWLGFIVTTNLSPVLWEKRDNRTYCLYMGFELVSLIVMSVILTSWV